MISIKTTYEIVRTRPDPVEVLDRFESELMRVELPAHDYWPSVLRTYARGFRDGLIRVGVALDHTPLRGAGAAGSSWTSLSADSKPSSPEAASRPDRRRAPERVR
jgi:hypothetical protein